VDNEVVLLSASSGWLDVLEVLASGMTGSGWDLAKACFNSWSSAYASNGYLATLPAAIKSLLDVFPDGDD
jgi:hypothetical protein